MRSPVLQKHHNFPLPNSLAPRTIFSHSSSSELRFSDLWLALAESAHTAAKMAPTLRDLSVMIFLLVTTSVMVAGAMAAGRPLVTASSSDQLISQVCSAGRLICYNGEALRASTSSGTAAADAAIADDLRNASIETINDLQEDFFLESALVEGHKMALHNALRDPAPTREFLLTAAADAMPPLTTPNAVKVMNHFGVAITSGTMATAVATAAHLCGSAALPGEARRCAASIDAVAAFVAAELGPNVAVNVYTTTAAAPTTASGKSSTTSTLSNIAKGSLEEGKTIVVCHHIAFPSMLYYCHRVTGTRVVQATLTTEVKGDAPIEGVGICHINTALWLSRHKAFAALKIARGEEACHWLVENDLVFTKSATAVLA